MNVLTIFEQRVSAIFMEGAPGQRVPFSFKRLAKRAVREMEDETFVIDGVDTAPALFTILVSAKDDAVMRPLYISLTDEISQLVEAQAKKRGYTFVGKPLVRFMVDPALRAGRFSVFAENIDPRTLARLRDEENAFLGITPPQDDFGYGAQEFVPTPVPVHDDEPAPVAAEVAFVPEPEPIPSEDDADYAMSAEDFAQPVENLDEIASEIDEPMAGDVDMMDAAQPADAAAAAGSIFGDAEPAPIQDANDLVDVEVDVVPTCSLFDISSGKTYTITTPHAIIGRERTEGGIVLHDPNVSRRHAELSFQDGTWRISDLHSTNGTLVNDMDVREATLHEGDLVTIGLVNLEFRAG
ncbi:MAG: DUF3662 and FHA domain-containing protein [Coriobacteriales bacterium]|nr:DUF3662 and FHA domain-containing protein [Coriobacteriales bacterium]